MFFVIIRVMIRTYEIKWKCAFLSILIGFKNILEN